MAVFRVLIADGLEEPGQSILRASASVEDRSGISPAELLNAVVGCDALIVRDRTRVSADVLNAAVGLKVVGQVGSTVGNIDLDAAKKHSVTVVNAPAAATNAVSELTLGLMLALARRIPYADAAVKAGSWESIEAPGVELGGRTLGIIGYGRIGTEVGRRASAFGMNVVAYDPFVAEDEIRAGGAESTSLQELFAWSDFISLHLPFDVHTRDLIGPLAFSQMKDGVRLVCTAGTGILDTEALLGALGSGKVAGAALDVSKEEQTLSGSLLAHPRVIATPHIGAKTVEAEARASEDIAREVLAALRSEPVRWRVV